jgi:uncharacterized iron-regulated protein
LRAALLACALLLGSCASGLLLQDHPLAGRVWDVRAGAFVSIDAMLARAAAARHVILGETHDNPEHHRLQRLALEALARKGPRALALEQFDSEHQAALDAARREGGNAEALAEAGRFDRPGWNWALYRPLVEFALERGWLVLAANLSRGEARLIMAEPARSGLPVAEPALREALERDMIEGHCGQRPEPGRLAGMVEAQRARDARMARVLASQAPRATVLITGVGHARKDIGVPRYPPAAEFVSIAMIEVDGALTEPRAYLDGFATAASFDYLWFTPRAVRSDPCAGLRAGRP